jgi:transcriptional regulator with XRE-family HTH domain
VASIEFHKVIKEIRESRKMTQEEMSVAAGVSVRNYQLIEYGRNSPSWETLNNLLKNLNLKSCDLFGDHPQTAASAVPQAQLDAIAEVIRIEVRGHHKKIKGLPISYCDVYQALDDLNEAQARVVLALLLKRRDLLPDDADPAPFLKAAGALLSHLQKVQK